MIHIARAKRHFKNILIDYEKLQGLLGASSYDQLRRSHKEWVEEHVGDGAKERQDEWTGSVAVGSKSFIESVKASLGFRAKGRDIIQSKPSSEWYQLRESPASYKLLFEAENDDIAPLKSPFSGTLRMNNQYLTVARPQADPRRFRPDPRRTHLKRLKAEGLPNTEIGRQLGISYKTVKKRLTRVL